MWRVGVYVWRVFAPPPPPRFLSAYRHSSATCAALSSSPLPWVLGHRQIVACYDERSDFLENKKDVNWKKKNWGRRRRNEKIEQRNPLFAGRNPLAGSGGSSFTTPSSCVCCSPLFLPPAVWKTHFHGGRRHGSLQAAADALLRAIRSRANIVPGRDGHEVPKGGERIVCRPRQKIRAGAQQRRGGHSRGR